MHYWNQIITKLKLYCQIKHIYLEFIGWMLWSYIYKRLFKFHVKKINNLIIDTCIRSRALLCGALYNAFVQKLRQIRRIVYFRILLGGSGRILAWESWASDLASSRDLARQEFTGFPGIVKSE